MKIPAQVSANLIRFHSIDPAKPCSHTEKFSIFFVIPLCRKSCLPEQFFITCPCLNAGKTWNMNDLFPDRIFCRCQDKRQWRCETCLPGSRGGYCQGQWQRRCGPLWQGRQRCQQSQRLRQSEHTQIVVKPCLTNSTAFLLLQESGFSLEEVGVEIKR